MNGAANRVLYSSSTTAFTDSSSLTFDGTTFQVGSVSMTTAGVMNVSGSSIWQIAGWDVMKYVSGNTVRFGAGTTSKWDTLEFYTSTAVTHGVKFSIYTGSVVVNEPGDDVDFRVEGDTDPDLLFVDASTDRVGIGTNTPGFKFQVGSGATSGLGALNGVFVAHATAAYMTIKSGTNPELFFGSDVNNYGIFGTLSNHDLGLRTNNVLRMRINNAGSLVFNEGLNDSDFVINGDTVEVLRCDASQDAIGIGVTTPNAVAKLQIDSTTKGFLPPRMTTTQRDLLSSVPVGLLIFNTTTNKLNVRGASAWEAVTSS